MDTSSLFWAWAIALAGASVGRVLLPFLGRITRLRRRNFAGETITAGGGLAVWLPAALALSWEAWRGVSAAAPAVTALLVFGLVGLADDLWGDRSVGGFRGHLRKALREGRLTTGMAKLSVGGGAALVLGLWLTGEAAPPLLRVILEPSAPSTASLPPLPDLAPQPSPAWIGVLDALTAAATIALAANTLNLFDLRPLRALKVFWSGPALLLIAVIGLPLAAHWLLRGPIPPLVQRLPHWLPTAVSLPRAGQGVGWLGALLGPALVAALIYSPVEARRRAMLGDNGANALGALFGIAACVVLPLMGQVVLACILAGINVYAESHSLSAMIRSHPLLDRIDRWGWSAVRDA
jgi:UDP-GlcNAc:undecaprenyl-phosphate GlcNAc-1-phosphate transferase